MYTKDPKGYSWAGVTNLVLFTCDIDTAKAVDFFRDGEILMCVGCEQLFGERQLIGGYRMVRQRNTLWLFTVNFQFMGILNYLCHLYTSPNSNNENLFT